MNVFPGRVSSRTSRDIIVHVSRGSILKTEEGRLSTKKPLKHRKWLIPAAVVLIFCANTFGWGGGPINVTDFTAGDADRVELTCSHSWIADGVAVVAEKEDIQAVIDTVNGFRHDGTKLKYGFNAVCGGSLDW